MQIVSKSLGSAQFNFRGTQRLGLACQLGGGKHIRGHERRAASEHLVKDRADGVDVRGGGHVAEPSGNGLRSHIARASNDLPGLSQLRRIACPLAKAEVGDAQPAIGIAQYVGGFQVSMNHPAFVRVMHRQIVRASPAAVRAGRGPPVSFRCRSSPCPSTLFRSD